MSWWEDGRAKNLYFAGSQGIGKVRVSEHFEESGWWGFTRTNRKEEELEEGEEERKEVRSDGWTLWDS